jgi:hypothetical protein
MAINEPLPTPKAFENQDYYQENGFRVFTSLFLKKRGYCCGSRCRHCPYNWINVKDNPPLKQEGDTHLYKT